MSLLRVRSGMAVGAMATILTLSMPGQAFAAPGPPPDPDCQLDPNNPECQNGPPPSPDATGCAVDFFAPGCQDDTFGPESGMDIYNSFDDDSGGW